MRNANTDQQLLEQYKREFLGGITVMSFPTWLKSKETANPEEKVVDQVSTEKSTEFIELEKAVANCLKCEIELKEAIQS